jgi:plasmid stabilization system protein ParE
MTRNGLNYIGKELYAQRRQIKLHGQAKAHAEHIEEGYENRGVSAKESEKRAWATVNKVTGGGKKSGSGHGKR